LAEIQSANNSTNQNLTSGVWTKMTNFDTNTHDIGSLATADQANSKVTLGVGTWEVWANLSYLLGVANKVYNTAIWQAGATTGYEGLHRCDGIGVMQATLRGTIVVSSGTDDIDFRMKTGFTGNVKLQWCTLGARLLRTT